MIRCLVTVALLASSLHLARCTNFEVDDLVANPKTDGTSCIRGSFLYLEWDPNTGKFTKESDDTLSFHGNANFLVSKTERQYQN